MTDRDEEDEEEELFSRGEVAEGTGCSRGDLMDRLLSFDFSRGDRGCEEDIEEEGRGDA